MPFQIHFQFIDRKFFKKVQNFNFAIDYLYFLCYTQYILIGGNYGKKKCGRYILVGIVYGN